MINFSKKMYMLLVATFLLYLKDDSVSISPISIQVVNCAAAVAAVSTEADMVSDSSTDSRIS